MTQTYCDQVQDVLIQAFLSSQLKSGTKFVKPLLIYIKLCINDKLIWSWVWIDKAILRKWFYLENRIEKLLLYESTKFCIHVLYLYQISTGIICA